MCDFSVTLFWAPWTLPGECRRVLQRKAGRFSAPGQAKQDRNCAKSTGHCYCPRASASAWLPKSDADRVPRRDRQGARRVAVGAGQAALGPSGRRGGGGAGRGAARYVRRRMGKFLIRLGEGQREQLLPVRVHRPCVCEPVQVLLSLVPDRSSRDEARRSGGLCLVPGY